MTWHNHRLHIVLHYNWCPLLVYGIEVLLNMEPKCWAYYMQAVASSKDIPSGMITDTIRAMDNPSDFNQ